MSDEILNKLNKLSSKYLTGDWNFTPFVEINSEVTSNSVTIMPNNKDPVKLQPIIPKIKLLSQYKNDSKLQKNSGVVAMYRGIIGMNSASRITNDNDENYFLFTMMNLINQGIKDLIDETGISPTEIKLYTIKLERVKTDFFTSLEDYAAYEFRLTMSKNGS